MTASERKHLLRLACACDRLELQVRCDRRIENTHPFAATLSKVWPWIGVVMGLRRRLAAGMRGGSMWGRLARLVVTLV
jgi:hypothetical protein